MAVSNLIQFAVVREDPAAELELAENAPRATDGPCQVLLIASGGCTALTLATSGRDIAVTALDANRAQLDLVERKLSALCDHGALTPARAAAFGVGRDDPASLTGCGNFESLFRGLRAVLDDLVMPLDARRRLLAEGGSASALTKNRYWPVAFQMFFSDAFLEAMFGPDATQHAARGSYPAYFQHAFETGLSRSDAAQNYLLHHALLGAYIDDTRAWPDYLRANAPPKDAINLVHAPMGSAPPFSKFGLISLSNIFDWMSASACDAILDRLKRECRPGTVVVLRQLNNRRPVDEALAPAFRIDRARGAALLASDRSLFYERIVVAVKNGAR